MEHRPIIIVGAGPAGTSAALHLHREDPQLGHEVLVLEKARHPRPKVCAGGLIPNALTCLRTLDVELTVPQVRVRRTRVTTPRRVVQYEDDQDLCIVIRRAEFDGSLVRACLERGISVQQDEAVTALERDATGVRVETTRATYHTPLLIGADGSGSLVRRRLVDGGKHRLARAVMCDVPVEGSSWSGFAAARYDFDFRNIVEGIPGYRWTFPCLIDGVPHANVGIYALAPMGRIVDQSLDAYVAELGAREARRQAFPIHWYAPHSRLSALHVLLTGDAAGVDPLMGEGISLALEYGKFAATAATRALATRDFSGREYQREIEASWLGKKLRRLHWATRLFYGPTWKLWFSVAERSRRARRLGVRWYNGIDDWDRRSGWDAVRTLVSGTA